MDIKKIAEQVSKMIYVEDGLLLSKFISEKFAEALIESYKADELEKVRARVAELEERRCEVCGYAEHHREHTGCLRKQVSSLKAELREICAAIDDPASDLTLTTVECIKKLKAENEWRDIKTAPKDNTVFLAWRKHATHPLMVRYEPSYDWFANYDGEHVYDLTHWMPLPKPPAMAQGEQGC